jgi:hypothetical protein
LLHLAAIEAIAYTIRREPKGNPTLGGVLMRSVGLAVLFSGLAAAQNSGVPPRPSASEYPVHAEMKSATLAAAIVPSEKVRKMFSSDVNNHYVVVEVAVYPGQSFDVDRLNFSLKIGDTVSYAARPREAAESWPERRGPLANGPEVTTETGVIYERSHDPINGTGPRWEPTKEWA